MARSQREASLQLRPLLTSRSWRRGPSLAVLPKAISATYLLDFQGFGQALVYDEPRLFFLGSPNHAILDAAFMRL